jgi:hypothetical protein
VKQDAGAVKVNIRLVFIVVQIILYISFLTIDITGGSISLSAKIKFGIILLCFCYALFSRGADKSILFCLRTALLFTVISDLFLLILDYYFYGVLTFIVVQQLYSVRLSLSKYRGKEGKKPAGQALDSKEPSSGEPDRGEKRSKGLNSRQFNSMEQGSEGWIGKEQSSREVSRGEWKPLIRDFFIRLGIQAAAVLVICLVLKLLGIQLEALLIASVFYFICILTNTVRGVKAAIDHPWDKGLLLYAFGISLFLLCDINVGFFNISGYIALPEAVYDVLYSLSSILMWAFYAPSQVLITLSIKESR